MRHCVFILTAFLLFSSLGCGKKEKVVIRLNDICITAEEFQTAYRASPFFREDNSGIRAFLDQYISKKMILVEAERQGLDKGPEFLADIQQYWEQELLKLTLAKVNSELSAGVVSDKDIEDFYAQKQQDFFAGKELSAVRDQIKEYLTKERKKEALQKWLEDIKQRTHVEIDSQALGIQ